MITQYHIPWKKNQNVHYYSKAHIDAIKRDSPTPSLDEYYSAKEAMARYGMTRVTLYGTLSKEEKNIVGSSLSYLESLVQILQSKTILPSLRLREQKSNIMDKQADYSNNLNTCQARYPGTNNKIWCNLPYTIIDIKFNTSPYAGGKPLNECPGWTELNADWGHIDSITIKDGMGNEHIFAGNQIDDKNRIVFELEDMTVKYSIETGGAEFFPHPKKDKTEVQQRGQMIQQAVHKGKGI